MRMSMTSILAEEREENRAEDVERGHTGRNGAYPKQDWRAVMRREQDGVLAEPAGGKRETRDRQRGREERIKRDRRLLAEPAHILQVLLAAERVDDGSGAEEEQRLEERVRNDVPDAE